MSPTRSEVPTTYAAWASLLDRFAEGDDAVLGALHDGKLEWTAIVAERFTRRITEAFNSRLKRAVSGLQRELDGSRGNAQVIGQGLIRARTQLGPLASLAALPVLPGEVRDHLRAELERLIRQTQASLERSAAGSQGLLDVLRTHALKPPAPTASPPANLPAATGPARRNIL
jgi:hypothetical protein